MSKFSLESIGIGCYLYLTAAPDIKVGARLSGGHFRNTVGQGICQLLKNGNVSTDQSSLQEIVWELVRVREFPSRPCRFDALFLWPDETSARAWHYRHSIVKSATGSQRGLYKVEVEDVCQIWAADMNLISYIRDGETVGSLMQRARQYWESTASKNTPEILLNGRVKVCKNLRELGIEQLVSVQEDSGVDSLIRDRFWPDASGYSCSLLLEGKSHYYLSLRMTVATDLPRPLAGWIGLEIEGLNAILMPRRGTEPILATGRVPLRYRPDDENDVCETPYEFKDPIISDAAKECVLGKRHFRPVLICDREAAYYWQLPFFWEGQIYGHWITGKQKRA